MGAMRGLAEVVISVRDLEKAVGFYRDVLGLKVISPPGGRGAVFLQVGEDQAVPHQLVLAPLSSSAPDLPAERNHRNMRHYAIEVAPEDFERERARLEGRGLEVRYGEHPFLPLKALYVDDPDGNEIELVTRRE
jgi:catechol 2,3-dioxygenase-like lactoylglutathione lyase family enzyme